MNDDRNPSDRPQTCVRVSVSITLAGEARGDLAGLVGNMAFDLGPAVGLSRQTSSKANVHLVEEITNVLEHRSSPLEGELKVELSMVNDEVIVDVMAPEDRPSDVSTDAWFPPDEPHATAVNLTMKTMRRKRVELAELVALRRERANVTRGGLELMRLQDDKKKKGGGSDGDGGSSAPPMTVVSLPLPKKD